jgi:hypothetical protein
VWTLALDPVAPWRPVAAPSAGGLHAWRAGEEAAAGAQ